MGFMCAYLLFIYLINYSFILKQHVMRSPRMQMLATVPSSLTSGQPSYNTVFIQSLYKTFHQKPGSEEYFR